MSAPNSQNSAVRDEAIAAWARIRDNVLRCENGSKIHHSLLYAVDAWLKASASSEIRQRDAVLEEAAKVCEAEIASPISEPFMQHCANQIRALKDKP